MYAHVGFAKVPSGNDTTCHDEKKLLLTDINIIIDQILVNDLNN